MRRAFLLPRHNEWLFVAYVRVEGHVLWKGRKAGFPPLDLFGWRRIITV